MKFSKTLNNNILYEKKQIKTIPVVFFNYDFDLFERANTNITRFK